MNVALSAELTVLALAALLQVLQLLVMAVPANKQLGVQYTASPRDEGRTLSGVAGRLHRAMGNHFEGLILFTIAVVVVVLGERSSTVTVACAWTYLTARVVYVPLYAFGVPYLRSLVWSIGFFATVIMLLAALV